MRFVVISIRTNAVVSQYLAKHNQFEDIRGMKLLGGK